MGKRLMSVWFSWRQVHNDWRKRWACGSLLLLGRRRMMPTSLRFFWTKRWACSKSLGLFKQTLMSCLWLAREFRNGICLTACSDFRRSFRSCVLPFLKKNCGFYFPQTPASAKICICWQEISEIAVSTQLWTGLAQCGRGKILCKSLVRLDHTVTWTCRKMR